eukprot:tig00000317_g24041.t1
MKDPRLNSSAHVERAHARSKHYQRPAAAEPRPEPRPDPDADGDREARWAIDTPGPRRHHVGGCVHLHQRDREGKPQFHLPFRSDLVRFDSREEAELAGRTPCKVCQLTPGPLGESAARFGLVPVTAAVLVAPGRRAAFGGWRWWWQGHGARLGPLARASRTHWIVL